MNQITHKRLYEIMELPLPVRAALHAYEAGRTQEIPAEIYRKLFVRGEWEQGVRELQSFLGEDPMGMKILWEQLNIVCKYTYGEYRKLGISDAVFTATVKFCTRFLYEHYAVHGTFKYIWAWWFLRQMSVQEFRIGALEYEFTDGENREIAVHIPSDADMKVESIRASLVEFNRFREKLFPEWKDVPLTCDSWMMMPELQELLGDDSKIVAFQKLFEIDIVDHEAVWYMGWIYPGYETVDDKLPEGTRLQRELKKFLLAGNKFGVAKGHLREMRDEREGFEAEEL